MDDKRKYVKYIVCLIIIPMILIIGYKAFGEKRYAFITMAIAVCSVIPFALRFENKKGSTERMVILSVMIALCVVLRYCFSMIPHFKPVTALVVITGIYMGGETGFLCGAFSAVLSNFIFGQGPWTPFQMFAWGMTGLVAGIFSKYLKKSRVGLGIYGAASGIMYSLIMDIWTAMWQEGVFNIKRYIACVVTSLPVMAIYIVSNIIFLWLMAKPIGEKIERVKKKMNMD